MEDVAVLSTTGEGVGERKNVNATTNTIFTRPPMRTGS
jgi:hypothetical protein